MRHLALWFYVAAAALTIVALVAPIAYLGPVPPRVVVMTTGTAGGAYDQLAQRYHAILARSGVELRLLPSAGAIENLARLNDEQSGVSVGFAQNGLTSQARSPHLVSLGTINYEPVWLFYQGDPHGEHLEGLRGRKVSVGPEGR